MKKTKIPQKFLPWNTQSKKKKKPTVTNVFKVPSWPVKDMENQIKHLD